MDSLFAKADAVSPKSDFTLQSVSQHTSVPKSLRNLPVPDNVPKHSHIANRKLRNLLHKQSEQNARGQTLLEDADMFLMDEAGKMEVEHEMEKTWRAGRGRREWKLDGGPYRCRYTRNGRHLAIVGRKGHVGAFDWQLGTLHSELQLQETCRDITFLHDHSFYAVAQKKYIFIYDRDGVEIHRLKSHIEPTRLEFLPYHWLLASIGNPGYLKYQDTSTGQLLVEHRTKLGACNAMTQNFHNAVIYLGHQNGCVTLWTPNLPHPAVQLLAHLGPVVSVSVDPSQGGRYMATAGRDGTVKVWDCRNWKGAVRDWTVRGTGNVELDWSARGYLAVANSGNVNVYTPPTIHTTVNTRAPPPLYMTHPIPHRPLTSVRFAPYQDILTIGHAAGLSSILVPGAGEPNFDSAEADPFENKSARREREVRGLLDKIKPDMITLDPDFVGSLAPPSKLTTETTLDGKPSVEVPHARMSRYDRLKASGHADETEEKDEDESDQDDGSDDGKSKEERKQLKEKRKMRGRNKSLKRFLRKQRKNIVDPKAVAIRAKLEKQREERKKAQLAKDNEDSTRKPSALDRFKRSS
ncbi:BING4CT-domain-containing protein [Amanita rubescens]|nr:BING4CT-domain-containing protein [Amanita rubescens]